MSSTYNLPEAERTSLDRSGKENDRKMKIEAVKKRATSPHSFTSMDCGGKAAAVSTCVSDCVSQV